jgi:hypothetical protein
VAEKSERASAADAALRAALSEMKMGALRKRAREAGVPQDALDDLQDAEHPRNDLIALIVAAAPAVRVAVKVIQTLVHFESVVNIHMKNI